MQLRHFKFRLYYKNMKMLVNPSPVYNKNIGGLYFIMSAMSA